MPRYIIVQIKDNNKSNAFAEVRKAIHKVSREQDINLADFGTDFRDVTNSERNTIANVFESVMNRVKDRAEMIAKMRGQRDA